MGDPRLRTCSLLASMAAAQGSYLFPVVSVAAPEHRQAALLPQTAALVPVASIAAPENKESALHTSMAAPVASMAAPLE